jgi:hypothetical protein
MFSLNFTFALKFNKVVRGQRQKEKSDGIAKNTFAWRGFRWLVLRNICFFKNYLIGQNGIDNCKAL